MTWKKLWLKRTLTTAFYIRKCPNYKHHKCFCNIMFHDWYLKDLVGNRRLKNLKSFFLPIFATGVYFKSHIGRWGFCFFPATVTFWRASVHFIKDDSFWSQKLAIKSIAVGYVIPTHISFSQISSIRINFTNAFCRTKVNMIFPKDIPYFLLLIIRFNISYIEVRP